MHWSTDVYHSPEFIRGFVQIHTAGGSIFLLIGVLGIGLYGSNEPTLNFETLAHRDPPEFLPGPVELFLWIPSFH